MRNGTFAGASVFLSRSLVPPEAFDALHDALRLNGAQVFLCCDPSRNAADDYHVISSLDHEKFEDLKAKGCNLLGPQCVLYCAKECRPLPKQGYICCLAMDGVKVLATGFDKDEKVKIEKLVTAMGGVLHSKASLDVSFVIAKNVFAAKYKWALNVLKKPIVDITWLHQCWSEHRIVSQEPYRVLPFSGLTICVTKIPADERKEMGKLIVQNGGHYSADLTKKCTHLISDAPGGDKYMVAQRWGHIHLVTRRWFSQSIARRACLDERFYPVHEASISFSNKNSSQKNYYSQSQTSQPALPTEGEEFEATLSQNMPSAFSDATKFTSEGNGAPVLQKEDEVKFDSSVAEDSETEDNDLYLSNCRILLLGFDEKELRKLVSIIRRGGGTRHMLLSEKLTHIIVGTPSEIEKKEIRRLAAWGIINVVKAAWLEECDIAKKELPVSLRHNTSGMLLQREPSADICGNKKGKVLTGSCSAVGQGSENQDVEAVLQFEKRRGKEKPVNGSHGGSSAELATKSERLIQSHAVNIDGKQKRQMQSIGSFDAKCSLSSSIFKMKSFCFSSSFPDERRAEIIEWVRKGGGMMVDDHGRKTAHFIIEQHGLFQVPADISAFTVVTPHWVRCCLEEGCMKDVSSHVLFSPLHCHIPLPGFEGLRFCISQYEEKDRLLLRNLCHTLGAKFTDKLTKKVTHLLCKFTNGPKYEAACKWGIQSITADWITECIKQDTMVSLDPFRPKAVTTEDREAGLCTMTQRPTQAARMFSRCDPSQLPSESQGEMDTRNVDTDTKNSSAPRKRPRLSDNERMDDTSKKNKMLEDLRGDSHAVPDVADAIEDLLAQSNKMQGMKSPGRAVSDRAVFSPHHSILAEDHANSHSSFDISRHWLNRTHKIDHPPNASEQEGNKGTHDTFSETQTESQVVGYEEDLSGRQKIIDRFRSQSTSLTPDKYDGP